MIQFLSMPAAPAGVVTLVPPAVARGVVSGTPGSPTIPSPPTPPAGAVALTAPAGFAVQSLPFAILRTGSGTASTFTTAYDHAAHRPATATTIHVAPGGLADAAGTQADPVPSINMAIAIGNASGQPYAVEIAAGTYLATQAFTRTVAPAATYVAAWYNASPTQNCAIYCPAGVAISSLQHATTVWVATDDPNIWRTTPANSSNRWVADLTTLDDTGVPIGLDQVRTVADPANPIPEINAAWTAQRGASSYRGTTMWVRLPDNRQPTAATVAVGRDFNATAGGGSPAAPIASIKLWLDNVQCRFGRAAFGVVASEAFRVDVYARNCAFLYAGSSVVGGEGLGSFSFGGGGGDVILDRCVASYSDLDGFNYHGVSQSVVRANCPAVYEIACRSRSAGWTGGLANNGSTLHEACTGVRIDGDYRNNADRTIHDINRAQSWNIGCLAVPRRGQDGSEQSAAFSVGHPTDGAASAMWLDTCRVGGGAQFPMQAYPGSTLRFANLAFVPVAAGGGTVEGYVVGV